ncbi:MAG: enoyl-CoA hydratase-related protein [Dehalococcoidia bacterium]|nr:enoyl-CoA hydratase-related protein [Dehalococcoidia bacterium]
MTDTIIYEKKGHIAYFTINRPEAMNAFDFATIQAFSEATIKFRDDNDAWVAIITGAGDKAFSAGFDLKELIPGEDKLPSPGGGPPLIQRGLYIWKPFIAAINGVAMGGGLELALACDLRIAAETATLSVPEVKWNLIPGWGGTQRLPRMIPMAKAAEMLLTGDRIDANEAYRIGIVNKVVPASELMDAAEAMANKIAKNGPLAVRAAKEAMIRGTSMTLDEGMQLELDLVESLLDTEDAKEGPKAFAEKRKPEFKGR